MASRYGKPVWITGAAQLCQVILIYSFCWVRWSAPRSAGSGAEPEGFRVWGTYINLNPNPHAEFACMGGDDSAQIYFMRQVLALMDGNPKVERRAPSLLHVTHASGGCEPVHAAASTIDCCASMTAGRAH